MRLVPQALRRQSLQGGPVLGGDWEAIKFTPLNSGPPAPLCPPPPALDPQGPPSWKGGQAPPLFSGELRSLSAQLPERRREIREPLAALSDVYFSSALHLLVPHLSVRAPLQGPLWMPEPRMVMTLCFPIHASL